MISYRIDTLNAEQICNYLHDNDLAFVPAFSSNVDILSYSQKLRSKARTYEAWEEGSLVGLLAAYLNEDMSCTYIPYICVIRKGIGRSLFNFFLTETRGYKSVELEVRKNNLKAINFYNNIGFSIIGENASKFQLKLDVR